MDGASNPREEKRHVYFAVNTGTSDTVPAVLFADRSPGSAIFFPYSGCGLPDQAVRSLDRESMIGSVHKLLGMVSEFSVLETAKQ